MAFDFTKSLQALQTRKFGDDLKKGDLFENFSGKTADSVLYISEAMEAVSKTYTENTFKQCDRVIDQIKSNISSMHNGLSFEYQGSVPLNVHIKQHSDIDLLIVTGRYHTVKLPLTPQNPYLGNPEDDHRELRKDVVETIKKEFPAVVVDNTGGKAVAIEGGSLNRKIDLVVSSWVHNTNSYSTRDLTYRGIKLYDQKDSVFIENYPFLHIRKCEEKDCAVAGKFKKLVRYVKNIIKDSENLKISSYDAAGLIYQYDNTELLGLSSDPVSLSAGCENFLLNLLANNNLIDQAMVPNNTRKLFGPNQLNRDEVVKLYYVLKEINSTVKGQYTKMFSEDRNRFEQFFKKAS
ncbi:MAG TPA: hypothetical protein VF602_07375 [Pedobacter sp.]|jgi:hypothetical protein